jgi:hypothetical protein
MLNLSQKITNSSRSKLALLVVIVSLAVILPVLAFSSHSHKIYVDDDASGDQTGSSSHPYKTIGAAMHKADNGTEIHVAKGTYKENVEIKKGVEIYGSDRDKVIIKAKHDDDAVVVMNDDTKINKVTIKEGRNGIWVEKSAGVSIIDCAIQKNKRNGIQIESDGTSKKREVYVSDSSIKDNGQNGILAGKRKLSLTGNEIYRNDADGVVIEGGSSAWIANNSIRENGLSGMKLTIDGSTIWTKKNSIRLNKREGVEVNFFGGAGRIDIAKSKVVLNGRNGVARVQRASANSALWSKYLTFTESEFWSNKLGEISGIFTIL